MGTVAQGQGHLWMTWQRRLSTGCRGMKITEEISLWEPKDERVLKKVPCASNGSDKGGLERGCWI